MPVFFEIFFSMKITNSFSHLLYLFCVWLNGCHKNKTLAMNIYVKGCSIEGNVLIYAII